MKTTPYILAVALLGSTASVVYAQDTISDAGVPRLPQVVETKPAEPDALARVVFGGSAGVMFSDNVFRTNGNEESDLIAIVAPGFSVRTDMEKHRLRFRARAEGGKYLDNSENDYVDVDLRGDGEYAINDTVSLLGDARLRYDHVPIGAFVDDPARSAAEPTVYRQAIATAGIEADNGVWYGLADSTITYFDYDNADRRGGGIIINEDRDRTEWE